MDTQQPPPITGDGSGGVPSIAKSSIEDMFGSNVDDPTISALVGQLESSIESSLMNDQPPYTPPLVTSNNNNDISAVTTNTSQNIDSITNDNTNINNNDKNSTFHQTSNGTLYSENNSQTGLATTTTTSTTTVTITTTITTNLSNHQNASPISTNAGQSSSDNLETNTTQSSDIGKRILLSANSQPVNTSISNMTQQQQSPIMKMSPLTNGTMTPPQSPSLIQTSLQQQQTIPVGQQVALVAASQSHVNNNSSIVSSTGSIRPSSTTPTLPQTSAITSSFVMTSNQNKMTTVAQKSNPSLLTIQSNGQQPPQPMLIGQPSTNPNSLIRSANVQIANTPQVSLSNSMSIAAPASNLVIDPRSQAQQQIQLQQLGVSNAAASGSNVQFQIVNVNSPSRPTLTVPTASVSGTGYTVSNIITGTNASNQTPSKTQLPPRVVLHPNVRFSGVRSAAPGFAAPIALPGLVRGAQTILVKTENGQVHMVNVGPQALSAGQSPTQPPTIRLQVPTGAAGTAVSAVGSGGVPGTPAIRTQLAASPIVLPVTLAPGAVNNTSAASAAAAIQANNKPTAVVAPAPASVAGASSHQQPLSVHTTAANTQAASAAPSQMSPTTAKKKCKNFLSTLIRLASDQPENVASNVKTLIQGLIDDTIQPEDFTNQLQKELNSSPQPCLVPFLKKSLPYLRYSLMKEELTIDGVRPPPANATAIPSNITQALSSHIQNIGSVPTQRSSLPPGVRLLAPTGPTLTPNLIAASSVPGAQIITSLPPNNASIAPIVLSSVNSPNQLPQPNLISNVTTMTPTINTTSLPQPRLPIHQHHQPPPPPRSTGISGTSKSKSSSKSKTKTEKVKKEKEPVQQIHHHHHHHHHHPPASLERTSSSFRDDDDINDVAAMGGVNLVEESQRILAGNAEIIGQQIRSCKDEPFLYASPLQQRLNKIAKRYDLEDCSHDVVALVSHATEERLKTLVEQLGVIAEHRQEQLRNNSNYEIVQDIKGQAQFLQELDRIEKRRHEEQEREVLIKAAKSRSKVDDPDHIAIKARAKEMQRLEMEEIRQREANETALQAIGNPKKRLKTMTSLGNNIFGSTSGGGVSANNIFSTFVSKPIKRIKRVTMKDVLFMMEHDRTTVRSTVLYKAYAR